jgi:hypothetical protein
MNLRQADLTAGMWGSERIFIKKGLRIGGEK